MVLSTNDVFLSYRGEDTRKNFVDHLDAALVRNGITVYRDDDNDKSASFWKELENSRIAIVIFSNSYASSSWCLDVLVKIMERSKNHGLLVLPVFYYDFYPSSLRRQGSVFGELFAKYETEKVRGWASVLVEAANLSGIGLTDNRYQATDIKEIVETVLSKLNINKLYDHTNAMGKKHGTLEDTSSSHVKLTGMDRRAQKVKELLQVKSAMPFWTPLSHRCSPWAYDVFTCYEGDDTCKDFADKLHCALERRNIYAFRDDQPLARGKSIDSERLKIIEESGVAVVVLSKGFAASAWCLDELVKIMNCNEGLGDNVFPVFYDVDPSDVKHQKGLFGEAFMRNISEKVEIWRKALIKVASFAGWYFNSIPKSGETRIVEGIVDAISRRLDCLSVSVTDNLFGIGPQMKHVMSLLKLESDSLDIVSICGMGGIGKTTLARTVYDQVSTRFDGSCFVENIREVSKSHGLKHIQREMLSRLLKDGDLHLRGNDEGVDPTRHRLVNRKVLLVLDDVDDNSQLEALVGGGKWFGEGSRIIITTRDESLSVANNIMQTYYVKPLDDNESYQFLRKHAFKMNDSTMAYEDLLPQVVSYAAGLPLALKVLSSLLCGRSKKEWTSTLARLQVCPEKAIQDTLKLSYDGLDAAEKELFLHIAYFFNDTEKDYAVNILNSCGFSGEAGIRILEQKSLVDILKGRIKMHKLIQQMGRDFVRQMHTDESTKRSQLWLAQEVFDTFIDSKSMNEGDAIIFDDMHDYDYDAVDMTKALGMRPRCRLLGLGCGNYSARFLKEVKYLEKTSWVMLPYCPLPSLRDCSISEPWSICLIKDVWKLDFLDLSYSRNLIRIPDFTMIPQMKELKLECGKMLIEFRSDSQMLRVPGSVEILSTLVELHLSSLKNLSIPTLLGLKFGLKPDGMLDMHDLILDVGQDIILSEGETSQELVEDKEENIALSPGKGV